MKTSKWPTNKLSNPSDIHACGLCVILIKVPRGHGFTTFLWLCVASTAHVWVLLVGKHYLLYK